MYLYVLDQKSFNKLNKENNTVIIGVYEENCTISMLFKGMMRQLRKVMSRDIVFGIMEKHEYEKTFHLNSVKIYPKIVLFKNGEKIKVIDGFQNYLHIKGETDVLCVIHVIVNLLLCISTITIVCLIIASDSGTHIQEDLLFLFIFVQPI